MLIFATFIQTALYHIVLYTIFIHHFIVKPQLTPSLKDLTAPANKNH